MPDTHDELKKVLPELTPIEFQILLTLVEGKLHGYGIRVELANRTNKELEIPLGTLYAALHRMHKAGWVTRFDLPPDQETDAARRRYYHITDEGYRKVTEELDRMESVIRDARARIARAEEQLYELELDASTSAPAPHHTSSTASDSTAKEHPDSRERGLEMTPI